MSEIAVPKKRERPNIGGSVVNGKIRYTSVSQIKLFDKTSDGGCPRKWAYGYKFRIKLARTDAQTGGSDYAEKWEHYLTTGEDVLPPVLQPAKKYAPVPGPDLECERPLGDIEAAVKLRDAYLKLSPGDRSPILVAEMRRVAGLTLADIPVEGAADCRHTRGEYVDSDGILTKDPAGAYVLHIDDLKTVSRIYPQKVRSGQNAGMIIPSYAKTDAEVCKDAQMIGYARHGIERYPGMTHARLSLIYANTGKREAAKRTGIISVEQILERSYRLESVVREMEQVATAERINDIEAVTTACDSFTHVDPTDPTGKRVAKGCGYRYQCPLHITQVANTMLGQYKESAMSLFDQVPGAIAPATATPTAPLPPPLDDAAHAAAVALERARLLAEINNAQLVVTTPVAAVSFGFCSKCGTPLTADNASRLPSGEAKHIGCGTAVAPVVPAVPAALPTPAPSVQFAVSPPDAPPAPALIDAADPMSAEEIAQITDPALKAKVAQHAQDHAARALEQAAAEEAAKVASGTSVWCPGGARKIVVTSEMGIAGFTCQCSKHYSLKALKPTKEGEQYVADVPRHKPVKKEAPASVFITGSDGTKREVFEDGTERIVPSAVPAVPVAPAVPAVPAVVAPPVPVVPVASAQVAVPISPPVTVVQTHTNGHANGHAHATQVDEGGGESDYAEQPHPTLARRIAAQAFYVTTISGKKFSVIARNMEEAIGLAANHILKDVTDGVKTIDRLLGDVVTSL